MRFPLNNRLDVNVFHGVNCFIAYFNIDLVRPTAGSWFRARERCKEAGGSILIAEDGVKWSNVTALGVRTSGV